MDKLTKALNDYMIREFGKTFEQNLHKNSVVGLAYTTYDFGDDNEHEIQVNLCLSDMSIRSYLDNVLVCTDDCTLCSFIRWISSCGFDDVIWPAMCIGHGLHGNKETI